MKQKMMGLSMLDEADEDFDKHMQEDEMQELIEARGAKMQEFIEQILRDKGLDPRDFDQALEQISKGRAKVLERMFKARVDKADEDFDKHMQRFDKAEKMFKARGTSSISSKVAYSITT